MREAEGCTVKKPVRKSSTMLNERDGRVYREKNREEKAVRSRVRE